MQLKTQEFKYEFKISKMSSRKTDVQYTRIGLYRLFYAENQIHSL